MVANEKKSHNDSYFLAASPSEHNHNHLIEPHILPGFKFTKENLTKYGFDIFVSNAAERIGDGLGKQPTCAIHVSDLNFSVKESKNASMTRTLCNPVDLSGFHSKKVTKHILHDINAKFNPGSMTLILGPPGCGKTTLLRLLSCQFIVPKNGTVEGTITYNGKRKEQQNLESILTLVSQSDRHIPTLTAKETLEFAHRCQVKESSSSNLSAEFEDSKVDLLLSLLGLDECANTYLGNDLLRGVSGGQKRRVSVGEMLLGNNSAIFLDEVTTGLDAATSISIFNCLRKATNILQSTIVCSMLQPPPEVYELFDNIMVLDSGEIIYNGPRELLCEYFSSIGYHCPARKDIADFIQEVSTDFGCKYRGSDLEVGAKVISPRTAAEFAEAFQNSDISKRLMKDFQNHSTDQTVFSETLQCLNKENLNSYWKSFRLVLTRQWMFILRDVTFSRVRIAQAIIMGLLFGSLFYQTGDDIASVQSKMGLLFLTMLFMSLLTLSNISNAVELRSVLYKHQDKQFYPSFTYAVSESLVELFWTVLQVSLFGTLIYWISGLSKAASGFHFILFLFLVILSGQIFSQIFKLCAAICKNGVIAQVIAGMIIFFSIIFSGFIVSDKDIPSGWVWIYWINPFAWCFRALVLNEFLSSKAAYDAIHPQTNMRFGDLYLDIYGYSTDKIFISMGILHMLLILTAATILTSVVYGYIRHPEPFGTKRLENREILTDNNINDVHHEVPNNYNHAPVTISLQNISYTVSLDGKKVNKDSKNTKKLLSNIHGVFEPGCMVALMGSSGAGKTTLLDVVAGRKTAGKIEGEIFVNGRLLNIETFNSIAGYVEQTDMHEEKSTVREALIFSARLRLPMDVMDQQIEKNVMEVERILELSSVSANLVASLSNGERKLLTIGVEVVANPSVLFLDEPTSGLDARGALIVMNCVKKIACSGRTIICTIHQPSTTLFELFDKLLLLGTGGKMVFFGDLGIESSNLVSYFDSISGIEKIKPLSNPATFMLEVISSKTQQFDFFDYYKKSTLCESNIEVSNSYQEPFGEEIQLLGKHQASFWFQFSLNLERNLVKYWRSPEYIWSRVFVMIIFSLVFGSIYSGIDVVSTRQVISRISLIFISTLFTGIIHVMTSLPIVSADRAVFYREQSSRMYSISAYAAAMTIVELPFIFINVLCYINIFYWFVGLNSSASSFFWYWLLTFCHVTIFVYLGQFMVYLMPELRTSTVGASLFTALSAVFAGFFQVPSAIPIGWKFMYWWSPIHYTFEGLIVTQFLKDDTIIQDETTGKYITISKFVTNFFGGWFEYHHKYYDLAALLIWIVAIRGAAIVCLNYLSHLKR